MTSPAPVQTTSSPLRLATGVAGLDRALGGGLLPGSLTLVVGATGIGKTQLAMHFCHQGEPGEGCRGAIIDLSSRGDSQFHDGYSRRIFGSGLTTHDVAGGKGVVAALFALIGEMSVRDICFDGRRPADILAFLGYGGRRVLRSQIETDAWHAWQAELNRRTPELFGYVYQHLLHGTRRFIIDGIEPSTNAADSLQMDLVELIYHRMLRQEHDWLAREVLRHRFREFSALVNERAYDHQASAALVLVTTRHIMLDSLIQEPLADGDVAAGANTLILMGKQPIDGQMQRGLVVIKHRGSYSDSNILRFSIDDQGLHVQN